MENKRCSRCIKTKNVSDFYLIKAETAYSGTCKECNNEMSRAYKAKNRQHISEYNHEYKSEHKKEISKYNKKYNVENGEAIQKKHSVYLKNKRDTDPSYAMAGRLRKVVYNCLTDGRDTEKTQSVIGCDHDFFMKWIEFQFDRKMTFDNYASYWQIDHVDPCNTFDLTDIGDQKLCFHWSNTRPLKAHTNWSRSQDTDIEEINKHKKIAKKFLKEFEKNEENDYKYYYTIL